MRIKIHICDGKTKLAFVRGVSNSPADKRFVNSSPVWTGITARILRGFQGVRNA